MEWLEISDTTVESAKERALVHLGVHESDAEFEVLSEGRVGLFGRVKQEARVRARVVPTPVRPKERGRGNRRSGSSKRPESAPSATASSPAPPAPPGRNARNKDSNSRTKEKGVKPMNNDQNKGPSLLEQADLAESFVRGVAAELGIDLTFQRHDIDSGVLRIEAHGDGVGLLVGRRGGTAQAVDELVRTVLQRSGGTIREGKIRMDVGGVRARRTEALAEFTRQAADQAIENGEEIALEPMNRMDRKIVHDVVTGIEQVESRSEGEDPHRRVIITAVTD